MGYEGKTLSVKEFRELGYLQELNRRFLHPLGLALEVVLQENGQEYFGRIWDNRDDPEGWTFGEGLIDPKKAEFIYEEFSRRGLERTRALGWFEQPIDDIHREG